MNASPLASVQAIESRIDNAIAQNIAAVGVLSTVDARLAGKLEEYSASKQDLADAALAFAARLETIRDVFAAERAGSADHMTGAAEFAALILADVEAIAALASADRAALTSPTVDVPEAPATVPVAEPASPETVASVTGRGASERKPVKPTIATTEAPASAGAPVNRIGEVIPHGWESTATPEPVAPTESPAPHKANGRRRKTAAK